MRHKKIFSILILLWLIISDICAKGILQHPRKVYVLKTEHFDIFFPEESNGTAKFLADNVESLYNKAKSTIDSKNDVRIMVVLSPDSEVLSVSYTNSPFKRIVIYDAAPEENQAYYEDILLGEVYRQVFVAVSSEVRGPKQNFGFELVKKVAAPISVINLPFSFIEGFSYLAESENGTTKNGRYNDGYFLQILTQAKMEKKFPSYLQASVSYDIYPGDDLVIAASTGFTAYLMQAYGYEKYIELWNECGNIHPFMLAEIFPKVYGKFLGDLWKEFEESIPLPADIEYMDKMAEFTSVLFAHDSAGLYQQILLTPYGMVWYDALRHEVDVYDTNKKSNFRQLLFFTDEVQRMTLSPDGRYVTISYIENQTESEFKKQMTWIFDLRNREFLDCKYHLKESSMITLANGEKAIAGVKENSKAPEICVYSLAEDEDDQTLMYSKQFDKNHIPSSLVYAGENNFAYLLRHNNQTSLNYVNITTGEERSWKINNSQGQHINLFELRLINTLASKNRESTENDFVYTFQYISDKENTLTRMGYIELSKDYEPKKIYLQEKDLHGGVYYPVIYEDNLYYCSKKLSYNQICYLPASFLKRSEGILEKNDVALQEYVPEEILFNKKSLGEYKLSKYYPLRYAFPPSVLPFFPVRTISIENGATKQPGLGVTINTHADPFDNNKFTLSAAWTFLDLKFSTYFNAPSKYEKIQLSEANDKGKDKSLVLFYENSSTPVDIKAGGLFNFNRDGEYYLNFIAGTTWKIPIGMNFGSINFALENNMSFSTDYFNSDLIDLYPSMKGWTSLEDSYRVSESHLSAVYTNIHQYGITPYEKFGFSFGPRIYAMYDFYVLDKATKLRDEAYKQIEETGKYEGTSYTKEDIDGFYNQSLMNSTQIIVGLFGSIEIPRLLPVQANNGWVLNLPTTITAEFLTNLGSALDIKTEILLAGKEVHNGISALALYFTRWGVKAGYDFNLSYDERATSLPDIRDIATIGTTLSNTYINDCIYMIVDIDLSSPLGVLSAASFNTNIKFSYYPRTNSYILNLALESRF